MNCLSRCLIAACLGAAALASGAADAPSALLSGPYKDVSIGLDPKTPLIAPLPAGLRSVSWGFATGECGEERWGDVDTAAFAQLNVEAHRRSAQRYIVSTGGEAGIFTCDSDEGMASFAARYDSPQLIGFDFDIEGKQTPAQIDSLMQRVRTLQQRRPQLRFSFTLATFAASDGSGRSLNALGVQVLQAARRHAIQKPVFNLMVMNYGPANPQHCVVKTGQCDMGASALQAARNLQRKHGVPPAQIALTAMLGVNDVVANVFTPADAQTLVRGARDMGLAGVHYWSIDRDKPCPPDAARVSPICHALPGLEPSTFTRILAAD